MNDNPSNRKPPALLTTADVARRIGRSSDRVRQLNREGKLVAQRTQSGQRVFQSSDVEKFVKERDGR